MSVLSDLGDQIRTWSQSISGLLYFLLKERKILGSHRWFHVFNLMNAKHFAGYLMEVLVQYLMVYCWREAFREIYTRIASLHSSLPSDNL